MEDSQLGPLNNSTKLSFDQQNPMAASMALKQGELGDMSMAKDSGVFMRKKKKIKKKVKRLVRMKRKRGDRSGLTDSQVMTSLINNPISDLDMKKID